DRKAARGGTAQMDAEARAERIPSVWFDPTKPEEVEFRPQGLSAHDQGTTVKLASPPAEGVYKEIADAIEKLIRPPHAAAGGHGAYPAEKAIADYFKEPTRRSWVSRLVYRAPWQILRAISAPFRPKAHGGSNKIHARKPKIPLPKLGDP